MDSSPPGYSSEPLIDRRSEAPPPVAMAMGNEEKAAVVPPSGKRWWHKYGGEKNVYCFSECCFRTATLPCFTMTACVGCLGNCGSYCWTGVVNTVCCPCNSCDNNNKNPELCPPPSDSSLQCSWRPHKALDNCLNCWPICCVGCLKFSEERTPDESANLEGCKAHCMECLMCPCNCCEAFFNSRCMRALAACSRNICQSLKDCVCGGAACADLVCRRLFCCKPKKVQDPQKQVMA